MKINKVNETLGDLELPMGTNCVEMQPASNGNRFKHQQVLQNIKRELYRNSLLVFVLRFGEGKELKSMHGCTN